MEAKHDQELQQQASGKEGKVRKHQQHQQQQ
jgi:hypothetical protein